jgi:hypothetical protein
MRQAFEIREDHHLVLLGRQAGERGAHPRLPLLLGQGLVG